mgnify:CR=1 FL=1
MSNIKIVELNESVAVIEDMKQQPLKEVTKQLTCYVTGYQYMAAFRNGTFDGKKRYYKLFGDSITFPKGLSEDIEYVLQSKGYDVEVEKLQYDDVLPTLEEFTEFVEGLNLPFKPRDYQFQAAFDTIHSYRQINLMATNSGKSLTCYILVRYFLSKNIRVVLLVPRIMLVNQMYNDFKDYGWKEVDDYVILISGGEKIKSFNNPITISTWQSLVNQADTFKGVGALIVDEAHTAANTTAKGNMYENIIFKVSGDARYRIGFTGTMPKDIISKISLRASLGEDKRYISTKQLIEMGYATPVIVKFVFFKYNELVCKEVIGMEYEEETKFFNSMKIRNLALAKIINKKTDGGNSIVLVDSVALGETLASYIARFRKLGEVDTKEFQKSDNNYKIYLINGNTKPKDREVIRKLMEKEVGIILIGTSSILSTGVNIKNLHNLFLTSGGKSFIRINQSIGRLLRTHPSKNVVKIWDIVDDACIKGKRQIRKNKRYKHFEERMPIYQEHDYETTETVIEL